MGLSTRSGRPTCAPWASRFVQRSESAPGLRSDVFGAAVPRAGAPHGVRAVAVFVSFAFAPLLLSCSSMARSEGVLHAAHGLSHLGLVSMRAMSGLGARTSGEAESASRLVVRFSGDADAGAFDGDFSRCALSNLRVSISTTNVPAAMICHFNSRRLIEHVPQDPRRPFAFAIIAAT